MNRRRLLLRAFCVWNFLIWAVLTKNMLTSNTHDWGFRLVHLALAAISLAFTVAVWPLAKRIDRTEATSVNS